MADDSKTITESTLDEVRGQMLPDEYAEDMASFLKVFGDTTRLRILSALSIREMCVTDLVELLDMTQSSISHQLRLLKLHRLVKSRKDGRNVYYSLDDQHVVSIFEQSFEHIKHLHK